MFKQLKALLTGDAALQPGESHGEDELQLAAAALLVEAATMDDEFDAAERAKVAELIQARFDLTATEAAELLAAAEDKVADSVQTFGFTRVVKDAYSAEERIELMEMLWEVAYVDGQLHDMEASLMRRIAGLLFISDRDNGDARKRALRRLES